MFKKPSERIDAPVLHSGQKKKALWPKIGLGLILLVVILFIAGIVLVKSLVNGAYLAEKLERSIDSKVEIGDVDLALFSIPTRITLSEVRLSAKEGADVSASVDIDQLDLHVSFWKLLNKHVDVSNITIKGADIELVYFEDGTTSLEKRLSAPEVKRENSSLGNEAKREKPSLGNEVKKESFNAFDQEDFVASLGGLVIENSRVNITLEKTGLRILCDDVQLELKSIKIDPKNLSATNTAKLNLSSKVKIESVKGWHYGDLNLIADAETRIFNPQTGDIEPNVEGRLDLGSESWLNTQVPFITKSWNALGSLDQVGIDIPSLPARATFGRSQAVTVNYHLGKVTVREPLSIWIGDWELAALADSWLQTETDQHDMNVELLASLNTSGKLLGVIGKAVEILPKEIAEPLIQNVKGKLYRDGRLLVAVSSTGEFSDPKIRIVHQIPDLFDEVKDAGEDALREKASDLLRGLFR